MEVKPGYKQTEVGVIPEQWEVVRLGDVLSLIADYTANGSFESLRINVTYYQSDNFAALVRTTDLEKDRFRPERFTDKRGYEFLRKTSLYGGEIVIANVGSVGKAYRVPRFDKPMTLAPNTYLLRFDRRRINEDFISQWMQSDDFVRKILLKVGSTTLLAINKDSLRSIQTLTPPLSEQRAIATALSDVDALLGGLERLIAKKRDLKQAAMQQLLTGQTRLPGFSGAWEVKRLGEVAEMGSGGTPLSSVSAYYGGGIPWVSIADMTKGGKVIAQTEKTLSPLGLANSAAQMFPAGTVLYAMYASLGECSIAAIPVCTSQAILGIRSKDHLANEFLYYFLASMRAIVKTLGQQGTQPNLNKGMVQDMRLGCPSLREQTAIAAVLTDMDAELAALEARRDKTRDLKQAMMQELLTGQTRLVKPEGAHA